MRPELFHIPFTGIGIPAYGTMLMVGFLLAVFLARRRAAAIGLDKAQVFDLGFAAVVGGILGARLLHILLNLGFYLNRANWPPALGPFGWAGLMAATWRGGLVFYGGLGGGILGTWLYARRRRIPLADILDFVAPGAALGLAMTRIGCFLNGCCYGSPTGLPWGVRFPALSPAGDLHAVHPAQLYETAAALVMCALLWRFYPRRRFAGQTACLFGLLYCAWRFANEFLRDDTGPWRPVFAGRQLDLGPLTVFQYMSLLLFVVFAAALLLLARRGRPPYRPEDGAAGPGAPSGRPPR